MDFRIRMMEEKDRNTVLEMMRVFYKSDAVATDGSDEIFLNDIDACINDSPYLEGYIFEDSNSNIKGYAMLAKSFSTEYGLPCIWIEDIYIDRLSRGFGIGQGFFKYIDEKYKGVIFRLEVEKDNKNAYYVYTKSGFSEMPYTEMKKINA